MNDIEPYVPEVIQLQDIPPYEIQDYDVFDDKDFRKYINDVKKCVRNSLEYRQYIQYLRNYMNLNECSFFQNVNNMDSSKIKIEIHHSPYTLEDIVNTVFNKRVFYGEPVDVEDVAKEVMYIHYHLMVGLIPLSETVHELVHNQYIFIPTDKVVGNYKEFQETYDPWIPEDTKDKIKMYEEKTLSYNEEIDRALLEQKQIPIQLHDDIMCQLPTMESLETILNNRLEEIKQQSSHSLPDNRYDNNIIEENLQPLIRGVAYDNEEKLIPGIIYCD